MNETIRHLVTYVDNGGTFSLLTFLKSYKHLSIDQIKIGYITLESIKLSLIQNNFNETLSFRSAHLQVIFQVAVSIRMTASGDVLLHLLSSKNEEVAFVGSILNFFDCYRNISNSHLVDFRLACTNFVTIMKKPKTHSPEQISSSGDDDSFKSKLLSREPSVLNNIVVASHDGGDGRSRGHSDTSRPDSTSSRSESSGHSKFLYLDNTRFMAQIRKQGSDLIFPQAINDKVVAMIFVALKERAWKPPHKDLIDFVMDCKEQCFANQGVDMSAVSKTKVRGLISLLKSANILSLERPDRPAPVAKAAAPPAKAAAIAVITPGTMQYRDRFLAIRAQHATKLGDTTATAEPGLLPARLLLVNDIASYPILRTRLDQHLVRMAAEMREDRLVREGLWTIQFVWDKFKYGPSHSATVGEYVRALEAFCAAYLHERCEAAADVVAVGQSPLLLLPPAHSYEPTPNPKSSPDSPVNLNDLGNISLRFLLSPDDRYTDLAPAAIDTAAAGECGSGSACFCPAHPFATDGSDTPCTSSDISPLSAGSYSTHSPFSSKDDGFRAYSSLMTGFAFSSFDDAWKPQANVISLAVSQQSFNATASDGEASYIDDVMSKIGFDADEC